ncbi:MAG: hypothetical protein JRE64_02220 [Deltaproteobacteria bacterium]|nr:hypothetical protein [Deltaproteobacteria bacterium]
MNKKVEELCEVYRKAKGLPTGIRFFFISSDRVVRFDEEEFSSSSYVEEFGFITRLSLNREDIIDVFAKLEYFINEFIQLKFYGTSFGHITALDEILEHLALDRRLRLIKKWGFISGPLLNKLTDVIKVRNQSAHIWNIKRAIYKDKGNILSNKNVFEGFKQDLKFIFEQLIKRYEQEQEKVNIEKYIDILICKIQNSNGSHRG